MSDKYISRDNLELAIDGLKVGMTPNWNENDKSVIGYIENRPFYTEYGVIVDNYSGSGKRPKCNFVVGNTYDVIWNGVTYKGLVCRTDGEYNFIGGDGYPFYIDNDGGNGFYVEPESGFTVSIFSDIVHQLDEKYIPDSIARVNDVEDVLNILNERIDVSDTDLANLSDHVDSLYGNLNGMVSSNTNALNTYKNDNDKKVAANEINIDINTADMMIFIPHSIILPYTGNWKSMAYGNGKFVAVSIDGRMVCSKNCINWVLIPIEYYWESVIYADGKFVAVGSSKGGYGEQYYSLDGVIWESCNIPNRINMRRSSIAYGDGKFVSAGQNGFYYSTDCVNWTSKITGIYFKSIVYGNDKFVATTQSSYVWYSSDGVTWNSTDPDVSFEYAPIVYGNGKFVTIINNAKEIGYSSDGVTWNSTTLPDDVQCSSIAYGDGKFVVVCKNSDKLFYSIDAITWSFTILPENLDFSHIAYCNNKFITLAYDSDKMFFSVDGINWQQDTQITQNNEDITDKVKDLILPISTTAQVGQLLSVKAVDENGKPTEWEAVNPEANTSGLELVDRTTGAHYNVYVDNGKLTMEVV